MRIPPQTILPAGSISITRRLKAICEPRDAAYYIARLKRSQRQARFTHIREVLSNAA